MRYLSNILITRKIFYESVFINFHKFKKCLVILKKRGIRVNFQHKNTLKILLFNTIYHRVTNKFDIAIVAIIFIEYGTFVGYEAIY